jgi:hypothetical protein
LTASALVALFAMAHHPTAGGGDFATFARNADRIASLNQTVHGTMIVVVAVLTWTVIALAMRRGVHRPLVILGLIAWTIGAACMIIAPSFNGFVITDLARRALAAPETSDMLRVVLQALASWVQVIATIGALGISAAMILWSADLIRTRGAVRWTGVLGTLAGAAPVIALSSDILRLDVGGMTAVLASWAAWFVAVGALMIQRKV